MVYLKNNISTNSLFHFVKKIEYLLDIIENGFQARYCYERIPFGNKPFAFPMKCFCDIPLGNIKYHIHNYGEYGIGIAKKHAKKYGVTPVIYVHDNSQTLINYANQLAIQKIPNNGNELMKSLIPYFKQYEKKKKGVQEKRYYDEREWRYIPENSDYMEFNDGQTTEEIQNQVEQKNKQLDSDKYRLPIDKKIDQVTFIIVKDAISRRTVINCIRKKIKNQIKQDILITKILCKYRIMQDF